MKLTKVEARKVEALKSYLAGLPEPARQAAKDALRLHLFKHNTVTWAQRALGLDLDPWQRKLVETPLGKRAIALTFRQCGKSTSAAVALAHELMFGEGETTSLILAPTQRQSAELIRRVRGMLLKVGGELAVDNTFGLELKNGRRVLGLPGASDAGIRGLSINGWLCIDEAAYVSDALYEAAMPMLLRFAKVARVALLSTAGAKQGFYYRIWCEGDPQDWIKIRARIEESAHVTAEDIARERRSMSEAAFRREYLCEFSSLETSFFNTDSIAAAFGDVLGPTPEVTYEGNDEDPIVGSGRAFSKSPFAEAVS